MSSIFLLTFEMFERRQYTFDIPSKKLKYLTLLYAKTIQYSTWFISPNQNFTNTKKFHCQVIFRYIDLFELIRRQYLLFDISFKKLKYLTFLCIFYTVHDVSSQINKSSSPSLSRRFVVTSVYFLGKDQKRP